MKLPEQYSTIIASKLLAEDWDVKVHDEHMTEISTKTSSGKDRYMIRLTIFKAGEIDVQ